MSSRSLKPVRSWSRNKRAPNFKDVGIYQYHHPAESSVALRNELDSVRAAIKRCVREKSAISGSANVTFGDSAAQGREFVSDMSRIMLRAYNAEAENCVKSVKAGNLATAQARLRKSMDAIEKQGGMITLRVTEFYHSLRLRELELAATTDARHSLRRLPGLRECGIG